MVDPPTPARRSRRTSAFTLIELLVVISIIALLIGILLPVLGTVRKTARNAVCLSNCRQMGIGLTSYSVDENGWYPAPVYQDSDRLVPWQGAIYELVTGNRLQPNQVTLASQHEYLLDSAFECPQAISSDSDDPTSFERSYAMNADLIGNLPSPPYGGLGYERQFKRADLITSSAGTLLLGDGKVVAVRLRSAGTKRSIPVGTTGGSPIVSNITDMVFDSVTNFILTEKTRHDTRINLALADGSAASREWLKSNDDVPWIPFPTPGDINIDDPTTFPDDVAQFWFGSTSKLPESNNYRVNRAPIN